MSYVGNNFSALNNYHYENKSTFRRGLDWFSTPCRSVLGGRNVYILDGTSTYAMTTGKKIATVIFSILFIPVAVISIACFLIKLGTLPWIWEKRKVNEQHERISGVINRLNEAYANNQYDDVIQSVRGNPSIRSRIDVDEKLFRAINVKINNNAELSEIQGLLRYLKNEDAIALIHHTIKTRLSEGSLIDNSLVFDGQIVSFVEESLKFAGHEVEAACYERLVSDTLRLDISDNEIVSVIKMVLAEEIIRAYKRMKDCLSQGEMDNLQTRLKINLLESNFFGNNLRFYGMLSKDAELEQIRNVLNIRRGIIKLGQQTAPVIENMLANSNNDFQGQWNLIRPTIINFKNTLNEVFLSLNIESNFVKVEEDIFDSIIYFFDSGESPIDEQKINGLEEIQRSISERSSKIENLTQNKRSLSGTVLNDLTSSIRIQTIANLYKEIIQVESFLIKMMTEKVQTEDNTDLIQAGNNMDL